MTRRRPSSSSRACATMSTRTGRRCSRRELERAAPVRTRAADGPRATSTARRASARSSARPQRSSGPIDHRRAQRRRDHGRALGTADALRAVRGALLATPPDFERPMPEGYPTIEELRAGGWLPVPRKPLPFPSIVAASRNDPLAPLRARRRAGARLGQPSSSTSARSATSIRPRASAQWPSAEAFIDELAAGAARERPARSNAPSGEHRCPRPFASTRPAARKS